MTTKPPPATASFAADSLESIAYAAVSDIPGREPNDNYRLGHSVWAWLKEKRGSLEDAVKSSGVRSDMNTEQIVTKVRENLRAKGVSGV